MLQDGLWLIADRHWRAAGDGRTRGGSDAAGGRVSWWPGEPGWGSEITFLYHLVHQKGYHLCQAVVTSWRLFFVMKQLSNLELSEERGCEDAD